MEPRLKTPFRIRHRRLALRVTADQRAVAYLKRRERSYRLLSCCGFRFALTR